MGQFIRIAARNLLAHRTRTLLIGGAITAVTALLVVLLSFTAGIRGTILRNATAMASGHVNVAGFYKLSQTSANPIVTGYRPILEVVREQVPEAALLYLRLKAFGKIISDTGSITAPMWGIDYANERSVIGHLPVVEGSLEDVAKPGHVAVFATHARKLKVKVGDTVTISLPTMRNIYNTKDVRIAAVLADQGLMSTFTTYLHEADVRELYQVPAETTGQIMILLRDPGDTAKVEERLRRVLAQKGHPLMDKEEQPYWMKFDRVSGESWTGQRLDVTTWQDETAYTKWVLSLIGALTFVFTGVLLAIVVLGLVNTMWMAIRERTPEVGTLRAIGLQRRQVLGMFLLEALLLTTGSILAGGLLGAIVVTALDAAAIPVENEAFQMFVMSNRLELALQPGNLALAFGAVGACMVLGSLLPAYRASKLKPITAINHV